MMNARVIVVSDIDLTQITERDVLRAVNREIAKLYIPQRDA